MGNKVKEWRQGLGVTQKALAEASGLDIRWIQKLEVGDCANRTLL